MSSTDRAVTRIAPNLPDGWCEVRTSFYNELLANSREARALAEHILALETDPYLQGHPEWEAFLNEAMVFVGKTKREERHV